jgi:hypothetical protein
VFAVALAEGWAPADAAARAGAAAALAMRALGAQEALPDRAEIDALLARGCAPTGCPARGAGEPTDEARPVPGRPTGQTRVVAELRHRAAAKAAAVRWGTASAAAH